MAAKLRATEQYKLDESDPLEGHIEISSQIFDFGFNRTTIQILTNQVWNRQICHSPVGFWSDAPPEITSRKCHIHRNCVDLIMSPVSTVESSSHSSAWICHSTLFPYFQQCLDKFST